MIPFVVPALVVVFAADYAALPIKIANVYAFGIFSFLTGSWWGMSIGTGKRLALWLSNQYFLLALSIFLFASQLWPLAVALLLTTTLFTEQAASLLPALASHYRRLRMILTTVASALMLVIQFGA